MLEDILRYIAKQVEKEEDDELKNAQLIGELPQEIVDEFHILHRERDHFREDLSLKKRMYAIEVERKLEEEFEPRERELKRKHDMIWEKVYQHMLVSPNDHYFHQDSKLYRKNKGDSDRGKSSIDFTNPIRNEKY